MKWGQPADTQQMHHKIQGIGDLKQQEQLTNIQHNRGEAHEKEEHHDPCPQKCQDSLTIDSFSFYFVNIWTSKGGM